jgi:hypothetical protein
MIESSFTSKGPATVEGVLNQDATQKACSQYPDRSKVPAAVAKKVEAAELKQVKYPADNNWIGDWKEGEKIAQNGRGMQFTDAVGGTNGGNCYACHQLTKAEIRSAISGRRFTSTESCAATRRKWFATRGARSGIRTRSAPVPTCRASATRAS